MFILDFFQRIFGVLEGVVINIPVDNALGAAYVVLQNIALILLSLVFGSAVGFNPFGGMGF